MCDDLPAQPGHGSKKCKKRKDEDLSGVRETEEVEGTSISQRSSLKRIVELLKQNLDDANQNLFKQSCFGHFLKFKDLIFQGPLILYLLRKVDYSRRGEGVLRFNVNGMEATFGPEEFMAITGLSFGPHQELPTSSDLYNNQFPSRTSILLKDLENQFKKVSSHSAGGGETTLKLALNVFMYGALLGRGFVKHKLNLNYFHVVDNLFHFNSYPWGRESYDYMVNEFLDSAFRLNNYPNNRKKHVVVVNGFMLALQVWAFEVYPEIGNKCGVRFSKFDLAAPHLFIWESYKSIWYSSFKSFVTSTPPTEMEAFKFSSHEEKLVRDAMPYNKNFRSLESRALDKSITGILGPTRRKLMFGNRTFDEGLLVGDPCPVSDVFHPLLYRADDLESIDNYVKLKPYTSPSTSAHDSATYMLASIATRLDGWLQNFIEVNRFRNSDALPSKAFLISAISHLIKAVETVKEDVEINGGNILKSYDLNSGNHQDGEPFLEPMFSAEAEAAHETEFNSEWISQHFEPSPIDVKAEEKSQVASLSYKEHPSENGRDYLGEFPSTTFMSPATHASSSQNQGSNHPIMPSPNNSRSTMKFSLMQKYAPDRIQPFRDWYNDAIMKLNDQTFRILLQAVRTVDLQWVRELLDSDKKEELPMMSDEDKCVGGTFDASSTLLMKYVLGELPLEGSLPWCDAREVYGIAHVIGIHWVAYRIDLVGEMIIVYDSLLKLSCWERTKSQFCNMSRFIPRLLLLARTESEGFHKFKNMTEWSVVPSAVAPPQQEGGRDCAIMAIKFIESFAGGFPIDQIKASKCSSMRLYYCAQLFNSGISMSDVPSVLPN